MVESHAFMSINFLPRFIEHYKSHRCLWMAKSKEYSNKQLKDIAYKELVDITKDIVPDCNVEFIKKKIDLLRGSYRREHKKVKASMRSAAGTDSVYTPKLWYYNLFHFLADQIEMRPSRRNLRDHVEEGDEEDDQSIGADETSFNEVQELDSSCGSVQRYDSPTSGSKRAKLDTESGKDSYLAQAVSILNNPDDEFDFYAKYLAAQLRNMDRLQNVYAQNIMNQVIFHGNLNKLRENTTIYTPPQ